MNKYTITRSEIIKKEEKKDKKPKSRYRNMRQRRINLASRTLKISIYLYIRKSNVVTTGKTILDARPYKLKVCAFNHHVILLNKSGKKKGRNKDIELRNRKCAKYIHSKIVPLNK